MKARVCRRERQQGLIGFAFVSILSVLAGSILIALVLQAGNQSHEAVVKTKKAWLRHTATRLNQFYADHASDMDADSATPWGSGKQLAHAANIALKYSANIDIGKRQAQGRIYYRTLTLWIPDAQHSNAAFSKSKALMFKKVSGLPVEENLYRKANDQLSELGSQMTAFYAGQLASDPYHNAAVNYWKAYHCSDGSRSWISCSSGWSSLVKLLIKKSGGGNANKMGIDPKLLFNPWGLGLEAVNTEPQAAATNPPYTIRIRTPLPWGGYVNKTVVEPVSS